MSSYYDLLGVPPDASHEDIEAAYAARSRYARLTGSRARLDMYEEAWAVLGDPARRQAYDRAIGVAPAPRGVAPPGGAALGPAPGSPAAPPWPPGGQPHPGPAAGAWQPAPTAAWQQPAGDGGWAAWDGPGGPGRQRRTAALLLLAIPVAVAVIMAVTLLGTRSDGGPEAQVGKCVQVSGNQAVIVPCTGNHNGKIVSVANDPSECPAGVMGSIRREADGGRHLCVAPDGTAAG